MGCPHKGDAAAASAAVIAKCWLINSLHILDWFMLFQCPARLFAAAWMENGALPVACDVTAADLHLMSEASRACGDGKWGGNR